MWETRSPLVHFKIEVVPFKRRASAIALVVAGQFCPLGGLMRKITVVVMAVIIAAVSVQGASARKKDGSNSGYCKSGEQVKDMANCKENGGKK